MSVKYNGVGIHKRLNALLATIGGYDEDYCISKMVEKYNLTNEDAKILIKYSNWEEILNEKGLDYILEYDRVEKQKRLSSITRYMTTFASCLLK